MIKVDKNPFDTARMGDRGANMWNQIIPGVR